MADGFFHNLLTVITKSDKIGFALCFAGGVVFACNRLKIEPFSYLGNDQLSYILFAALFGAGLVLLRILSWLYEQYGKAAVRFRTWRMRHTAPESRTRKFEQDAKWSFCLTAGTIRPANQERP